MASDTWVEYEGRRFVPPFLCMCCGVETDVQQWAYGRMCGTCDTGCCQPSSKLYRTEYGHDHPPWWRRFGTPRAEALAAFIAFAHVEPSGLL